MFRQLLSKYPPAWNSFKFDTIVFSSEFDSGNLMNVFLQSEEVIENVSKLD